MKPVFRFRYIIIDFILIAGFLFLDQYTKNLAVLYLKGNKPIPIIRDFLVLEYLENRGAAFGMLQNQKVFFLLIGTVFVALMIFALFRLPTTRKYRILRFFICLITAGAAGNLIDRAMLDYVIDFIYVIYIHFPIFNVADIYVTVSAAALLILLLFVYKEEDLDMKKARNPKVHSSMRRDKEENSNSAAGSTLATETAKKAKNEAVEGVQASEGGAAESAKAAEGDEVKKSEASEDNKAEDN
ncbi:MAG: signal peptidase II [Lachnospiraceae bacterium]|nr:signal peptidase II [Lachnospiraceae bacterium]